MDVGEATLVLPMVESVVSNSCLRAGKEKTSSDIFERIFEGTIMC